jgi:hypothetical protein
MKRPVVRYILILIVLAILILLIFKGRVPFGKGNTSFAVGQSTYISRIELIQGNRKIFLEESDDKWLINKKGEARKSAVFLMLKSLREMRIKSPVSAEVFDKEIIKMQIEPVKVNVFAKRRLVNSFLVYKSGSNPYGNIMKMKSSSKPFIVYIPGYEENIGVHFNADELFWEPFQVFHFLPSEIASVKLENISDPAASFGISHESKSFTLSDLKNDLSGWDTLKVKRYLTYFTSVSFENWAFDLSDKDKKAIESGLPLYRITVRQPDGKEIVMTIWERWKYEKTLRTPDTDRVWAKTNQTDKIFIMKYNDLDPVLKKRSYFLWGY